MDYKYIFFIFFFFLFKNIVSINNIFGKEGSVKVDCTKVNSVAFNSIGFNVNDEMFFTFKLGGNTLSKTIYYKFRDDVSYQNDWASGDNTEKSKDPTSSNNKKKNNRITSQTKYYTINKEKENKYLILRFTCNSGILTIENTKENKGKQNNIIIIVVVVICVVISIGIVTFVVIRSKKRRAAKAAMRMQVASGSYYPHRGMSMGMGAGMGPGMSVGVGMPPGYGTNYMMNNMPPQPDSNAMQPVAYSRMPNDQTQIEPNPSNDIPPETSGKRIKRKKV